MTTRLQDWPIILPSRTTTAPNGWSPKSSAIRRIRKALSIRTSGVASVGWSIGCSSFLGAVRCESVVFFALLGIGIGQFNRYHEQVTEAEVAG